MSWPEGERPEINLFADLETTKATSRHTLANVQIDVLTKTNRTEIPLVPPIFRR